MANRILREWDYDNDLNYENVYDSALDYITKYKPGVQSWREIASAIGYRMNTIGPNDMELLKDAIEDAMMESSRPVDSSNPSVTTNPMSDISMNNNQNESRIMNKKLIRLTESDLHRIVKESVERITEAMNTEPGQFQGGRLAYRKGEERPVHGQNIGKLRKSKDAQIFNYAEKAGKKAGLKDYGRNFRSGYDYESDIDDFKNAGDDRTKKMAVIVRKLMRNGDFRYKLSRMLNDTGKTLDSLSDEELLDIITRLPLEGRFGK